MSSSSSYPSTSCSSSKDAVKETTLFDVKKNDVNNRTNEDIGTDPASVVISAKVYNDLLDSMKTSLDKVNLRDVIRTLGDTMFDLLADHRIETKQMSKAFPDRLYFHMHSKVCKQHIIDLWYDKLQLLGLKHEGATEQGSITINFENKLKLKVCYIEASFIPYQNNTFRVNCKKHDIKPDGTVTATFTQFFTGDHAFFLYVITTRNSYLHTSS
jgi:hypothetical protein